MRTIIYPFIRRNPYYMRGGSLSGGATPPNYNQIIQWLGESYVAPSGITYLEDKSVEGGDVQYNRGVGRGNGSDLIAEIDYATDTSTVVLEMVAKFTSGNQVIGVNSGYRFYLGVSTIGTWAGGLGDINVDSTVLADEEWHTFTLGNRVLLVDGVVVCDFSSSTLGIPTRNLYLWAVNNNGTAVAHSAADVASFKLWDSGIIKYDLDFREENGTNITNTVTGELIPIQGDLTNFWQEETIEPATLVENHSKWVPEGDQIQVPLLNSGRSILTDGDESPEVGYDWNHKYVNPAKFQSERSFGYFNEVDNFVDIGSLGIDAESVFEVEAEFTYHTDDRELLGLFEHSNIRIGCGRIGDDRIALVYYNGDYVGVRSSVLIAGNRYKVRCGNDGTNIYLYLNDILEATLPTPSGVLNINSINTISSYIGHANFWKGHIFSVKVSLDGAIIRNIPLSLGAGTKVYDTVSGNEFEIKGDLQDFWQTEALSSPEIVPSKSEWVNGDKTINVPYLNSGEPILTEGSTPPQEGYVWKKDYKNLAVGLPDVQESRKVLSLNGINNDINIFLNINSEEFYTDTTIVTSDVISASWVYYLGSGGTNNFQLRILASGQFVLKVNNTEGAQTFFYHEVDAIPNKTYKVHVSLKNGDLSITVNGIVNTWQTSIIVIDPHVKGWLFSADTYGLFNGDVLDFKYGSDSNNLSFDFDFREGAGTKVYNKVDGQSYEIQGDLTDVWQTVALDEPEATPNFDSWIDKSELIKIPFNEVNEPIRSIGDEAPQAGYEWVEDYENSVKKGYAVREERSVLRRNGVDNFVETTINFNGVRDHFISFDFQVLELSPINMSELVASTDNVAFFIWQETTRILIRYYSPSSGISKLSIIHPRDSEHHSLYVSYDGSIGVYAIFDGVEYSSSETTFQGWDSDSYLTIGKRGSNIDASKCIIYNIKCGGGLQESDIPCSAGGLSTGIYDKVSKQKFEIQGALNLGTPDSVWQKVATNEVTPDHDLWTKEGAGDIEVAKANDGTSIKTLGDTPPETGYVWDSQFVNFYNDRYDAMVSGSNVGYFNGTDNIIVISDLNGAIIESYTGDAVLLLTGDTISATTAGWVGRIKLTDGRELWFSLGAGTKVYDTVSGQGYDIQGDLTDFWQRSEYAFDRNRQLGFSKYDFPNIAVNGDFEDVDNGWELPAAWSISGGVAFTTTAFTDIKQNGIFTVGKTYKIEFDCYSETDSQFFVATYNTTKVGNGLLSIIHTATEENLRIRCNGSASVNNYIDNVVVKEYLADEDALIPASTVNPTQDIFGNELTNPGTKEGLNGSENGIIQHPDLLEAGDVFGLNPWKGVDVLDGNLILDLYENEGTLVGDRDYALFEVTSIATSSLRPKILCLGSLPVIGVKYRVSFDYNLLSGECILRQVYLGVTEVVNENLKGSGKFSYTQLITDNSVNNYPLNIYFDGRNLFKIELSNIKVERLDQPKEVQWEDIVYDYEQAKLWFNGINGTIKKNWTFFASAQKGDDWNNLLKFNNMLDERWIDVNGEVITELGTGEWIIDPTL